MDWYLGVAYSDSCQPSIITETPETFPDPDMQTIIPDMVIKHPETDGEKTYYKNYDINESICHKLRKKDVYETNM